MPLLIRESDPGAPGRDGAARVAGGERGGVAASRAGDGLVREWPIGGPDASRHLGYALQWFALALLAAGAWLYFVLKRRDERLPKP